MATLFDVVKDYFEAGGWNFDVLPDRPVLRLGFRGERGEWVCFAQTREDQQQFVFYSRPTQQVPENRRSAVNEFITRANYGSIIGNFEIDLNDGEVRYKTSIDVEGGELTSQMVHNLVGTNVRMMDRYLGGLLSVALEEKDPFEALAEIERPHGPPGEA